MLETPQPRPKQKHRRTEPQKHRMPPHWCFSLEFFSAQCDFLIVFWIPQKALPFVCFDILEQNGCSKFRKSNNGQ